MLKNYFLTAWRNLSRYRMNALINVLGLSVAFTCCILLFLMVRHEFSYDHFHVHESDLYKVYNISYKPNGDEKSPTMGYPVAPTLRAEVPGIIKTTPVMWGGNGISYKEKELSKSTVLVSNDFFSMFSFPIIAGNRKTPLGSTTDVVINETTAKALFGMEDPVGKKVKVKIAGVQRELDVTAVIADAPANSSLTYAILARIELGANYTELKDSWNDQHHQVYVQIAPGITQEQIERGMREVVKRHNPGNDEEARNSGYRKDKNGDMGATKLVPFDTLHFDDELGMGNVTSKTYLYTMMLIAVIVMVIACFNFINLNVARSFTRAKEVGVRKTIGAGKRQIFIQLWTESFLLCASAVIIAIVAAMLLLKPFNQLFTEKLTILTMLHPVTLLLIVAGMAVVSLLAGGYPAWLVSRFNTVEVLKGKVSMNRSSLLRNGLIVFQFVMASVLICNTIVIYSQFQHLRNANLGYEQESVVSIPVKNNKKTQQYIRELEQSLAQQTQIVSITGSAINIGIGEDGSQSTESVGFSYNGKSVLTTNIAVGFDFLKTLDIKLSGGRDFSREFASDTAASEHHVIVTESMAKQFSEKNIVGFSFYTDSSKPRWTIIGVIPDIKMYSVQSKVFPLTLHMNQNKPLSYILVKTRTNNPLATMKLIKAAYKQIEPENETNPSFLTENTERWYQKEQRLSTIFFSSAFIAIFLSCLGLFAIVALVMEQRKKEIGVRKVLGATVSGITGLLSVDFLKLIVIAFLIATPVAWYFLKQWLQSFEYRVTIGWWLFPLAGVITLLIALTTIGIQTVRAALATPVKSLRSE